MDHEHHRERRLLRGWLVHGRPDAREQLVLHLLPLARQLARRYEATGEPREDLVQVASIGVLKAIDRFDLERSTSLRAYAARMADGELRHHLRDHAPAVHLPRALHGRLRAVSGAAARAAARLGRRATPEEIAAEAGLRLAEVVDALEARATLSPADPLDRLAQRGTEDPRYDLVEQRAAIDGAWRSLEPRERVCLHLRFVEDLTFAQVAARTGLSASHAERLTSRALARLRAVAER
jgi:RNA polymerase sigma-B factor